MVNVIGVRFKRAGKVYYFNPGELEIKKGGHVIVETARGIEFGEVILGNHEVAEEKVFQPLKEVIRIANEEDIRHEAENAEKQKEAFRVCQEKIRKHNLEMKLIDCEYTFDNSKILFYFTADGRIDFRDLVKDLAGIFRTRIELRQVGVRDETKLLGGLGVCGRPLCCHSYLSEFIPVSIKMAKEQNLSLNPVKISGVCGRLMCCLKNEEEVYEELNRKLPNPGDYVTTPDELRGEVQSVSILKQLVKVIVSLPNDEKEIREYPVEELQYKSRRRDKSGRKGGDGREFEALEGLEKQEKEDGRKERGEKCEKSEKNDKNGNNDRKGRREKRENGDRGFRGERKEKSAEREKPEKAGKEEARVKVKVEAETEDKTGAGAGEKPAKRERRDRRHRSRKTKPETNGSAEHE